MSDERPTRGLFGRKKGHPLRARQARLMTSLLPQLAIDLSTTPPETLTALFPDDPTAIHLEIGFGGAEHLIHKALANPEIGFIGCEPFINGMGKALAAIDDHHLTNIRLYPDDALFLLRWLPVRTLDLVYLLYPDPWPKRRHWKRRFVSQDALTELARCLKPGGTFRFASDIDTYVNWTLRHCRDHPGFDWMAEAADDWRAPWPGWPGTRYEAKAIREGRTPAYLTFGRASS